MVEHTERFGGIGRLWGQDALQTLGRAHVAIIGIGGVGSWTAEALARSGVGTLSLVDLDDICITNTNRQIHAVTSDVGRPKVEAMAERVKNINPSCQVHAISDFFTKKSADSILGGGFDFVVDAIDSARQKCFLIACCRERGIPIVTVGGAGGRRDPCKVEVTDINRSLNDILLKRVKKELRQKYGFPRGSRRWKIPCVFSSEFPVFPDADGGVCEKPQEDVPVRLDCQEGYGSASFVTGAFGFAAASVVVQHLTSTSD
jgi:tRNA A37 threonylcarbamoyladenosine dehydratase